MFSYIPNSQLHCYTLAGNLIGSFDGTTTTYYLTDSQGPLLLSFSASAILGEQMYGPYGNQRYSAGTINTAKGYTGQIQDAVTGLDYYNARYYDPVVGIFLSVDSVQGNILGFDPYMYVSGNPETMNDPTGHCGGWCWTANIIGVVAVVTLVVAATVLTGGAAAVVIGAAGGVAASWAGSVASNGGFDFTQSQAIGVVGGEVLGGFAGAAGGWGGSALSDAEPSESYFIGSGPGLVGGVFGNGFEWMTTHGSVSTEIDNTPSEVQTAIATNALATATASANNAAKEAAIAKQEEAAEQAHISTLNTIKDTMNSTKLNKYGRTWRDQYHYDAHSRWASIYSDMNPNANLNSEAALNSEAMYEAGANDFVRQEVNLFAGENV